ncbi:ATP-binding protein [Streptomyces sp. NPDC005805]|uniref:ATP-binding protein n=1 Tax=Streptomyces sp. NPDC005805 TaxID=3157068 RepID=UPI0033DF36FF
MGGVPHEALADLPVTDARAGRLPASAPDPEDAGTKEGGRGLMIVGALADDWGVDVGPQPPARKTVWAVIRPVRVL